MRHSTILTWVLAALGLGATACGSDITVLGGTGQGGSTAAGHGPGGSGAGGAGATGNWGGYGNYGGSSGAFGGYGNYGGYGAFGAYGGFGAFGAYGGFGAQGGYGNYGGFGAGGGGGTGPTCQDLGLTECNGQCVDTATNHEHCSGCNLPCHPDETCVNSHCQCSGGLCGVCGIVDLGSTVPQSVNGTTVGASNVIHPTCGAPADGPDAGFTFTAPATDSYSFDTFGSAFDTILHVHNLSCAELQCNDDTQGQQSQVTVALTAGQQVLVVVDGWNNASGTFTLHIGQPMPCPTGALGSFVPQTATGTTSGSSSRTGSCGGVSGPEASYTFTAPATALYLFDTIGSAFDTILYVRDGGCDGQELACNNDSSGTASAVAVNLYAGQQVVVFVDGAYGQAGAYALNVSYAPPCPELDLGSVVPVIVSGTTVGALNLYTGSCGGGTAPEHSYSFTAPAAATYTFSTAGSSLDTVLYVRSATCNGPQLGCNDDTPPGQTSRVTVALAAGQTVVVVVDGFGANSGTYSLSVTSP